MKKIQFFVLLCVIWSFIPHSSMAQTISEKVIKIDKKKPLNGFEMEFESTGEETEKALAIAIEKWLGSQKVKYKSKKGSYTATSVVVKDFSDKTSDLYILTEEKKGKVTLQVVQTLGYDLAVSSQQYGQEAQNIRSWMQNLVKEVRLEQLNLQLKALQELIKETEKTIEKHIKTDEALKNNIENYKKKIAEAENNIEKNKNEQQQAEQKRAELQKQIQELEKKK